MMSKQYEQKGSLLLRSDHMDYARATLISNWHQSREAEPKDHDVQTSRESSNLKNCRHLHQSTYDRILDVTDGTLPASSSHDHMNQIKLKADFEERISSHPMIDTSTFKHIDKTILSSETSDRSFGSILPRHPIDHNKRYLDTTYKVDYKDMYPDKVKCTQTLVEEKDNSSAYKKCHSQFTDIDDYRREGRNTWQNETGQYANSGIKHEVLKTSNPIPERLL